MLLRIRLFGNTIFAKNRLGANPSRQLIKKYPSQTGEKSSDARKPYNG